MVKQAAEENEKYTWKPDIKWLFKVLAAVYVSIIILFLIASFVLKPAVRHIPSEITPWLDKNHAEKIGDIK